MRVLKILLLTLAAVYAPGLMAQPACSFIAPLPPATVSFGNYSVFGSSGGTLQTSLSLTIDCVPPASTQVHLSTSSTNGLYSPRQMGVGVERLDYNAYLDAAGTQIFGNGAGNGTFAPTVTGQPGNRVATIPVYLRTTLGADAAAGLYADTLTVSLTNGKDITSVTFQVTANVLRECQVSTFTLPFGNYDPVSAHLTTPLNASTTVNVFCTRGVTGQVSMSAGNNPVGSARQLAFGANRIQYNIFREAARTSVWNTVNRLSGTSTSKATPLGGGLIGYGQIPPGQPAVPGSYFDTLVATVEY